MTKVVAIDYGTQSVRASLFDQTGHMLAFKRAAMAPLSEPKRGWAEQDPEYAWQKTCEVCRALTQDEHFHAEEVKALALTAVRGSVINLDKDGRPLRPTIMWPDERQTPCALSTNPVIAAALSLLGLKDTLKFFESEAESRWIAKHQPDIWANTHKFVLLSGYLNFRLTGKLTDVTANQVAYIPFDYKRHQWAGAKNWKWHLLKELQREMLPDLVAPGEAQGEITAAASQATGLPEGLPLIAACADKAAEVVSTAAMDESCATLSFASAATLNVPSKRYVEVPRFFPGFPYAWRHSYINEVRVPRGYWLVTWFGNHFGQAERELANELGVHPESLLDKLLERVPPGADGLIAQPHWSPSLERPQARGALVGFHTSHTRAHVYRALIEGIAFALKDGLKAIEKKKGHSIKHLYVAGGGSQSDIIVQMTADIFGLPTTRLDNPEAASAGAAMIAAFGAGLYPSIETAIAGMQKVKDTFEPAPDTHQVYKKLFSELYQPLYPRLKPLLRASYKFK